MSKAASRALGTLFAKVVETGGMTHKVYTKLYSSTVEPILMYGSGIWGTKEFSCITAVQNRACKYFLSVGKHTSNIATRGDMGWTSCWTKQRINFCRLLCRLSRTNETRKSYKIFKWISRRKKGWTFEVEKTINRLYVKDTVNDLSISTKCAMRLVSDKLVDLDNTEWYTELFNDKYNTRNGNKLRTFRMYKNSVNTETYVKLNISRMERRTMALFRSGSLPLAIEVGRYSRPPIPTEERLCVLCDARAIEDEKHFLLECPLYSDLRYDLFYECCKHITNFDNLNINDKFLSIMNGTEIQHYFCKSLHKFFIRRKLFL